MTSDSIQSTNAVVGSELTWDLESIFDSTESWRAEFESVKEVLPGLDAFRGRLLESPESLLASFQQWTSLAGRVSRLHTYAYLLYSANAFDESARALLDEAEYLGALLNSAHSFFNPELLAAPAGSVERLVNAHPPLEQYRHFFSEIERHRPYTLNSEVERALQVVSPVCSAPEAIRTALNDAELVFDTVDVEGKKYEISHGTIDAVLSNPNRLVRRSAFESYADGYLRFQQTFAQTLAARAKASVVFSKVRGYSSTFEARMFADAFPEEIFHAVLNACKEHRPLFRRYFKARARILGVSQLAEYDLLAPLSVTPPEFPYEQGRALVLESLTPLGGAYLEVARRGLYEERWVDVYPRRGKYSNAFSSGTYGTRPFLLLNYAPTMTEVGTLAHELGHSMHSYLTHKRQPLCYSSYAMSVAETASNLNQVLLRAKLLERGEREVTLAILEEAFFFAHRYLFLMPTMSEVEHRLHSTYAQGGAMSASEIAEATVSAFSQAYGDSVEVDARRLGVKWAKFCHFYMPYYFFQYAIGISAAMAIGQRIINNEAGIQEKYLEFLSAGASRYPTELFKIVDIDITSPQMYRSAFKVVERYVELLERFSNTS